MEIVGNYWIIRFFYSPKLENEVVMVRSFYGKLMCSVMDKGDSQINCTPSLMYKPPASQN